MRVLIDGWFQQVISQKSRGSDEYAPRNELPAPLPTRPLNRKERRTAKARRRRTKK